MGDQVDSLKQFILNSCWHYLPGRQLWSLLLAYSFTSSQISTFLEHYFVIRSFTSSFQSQFRLEMFMRTKKAFLLASLTDLQRTSFMVSFLSEYPSMRTRSQTLTLFSSGFQGFIWRRDTFYESTPIYFRSTSISLSLRNPVYLSRVDIWKYLVVQSIPIDSSNNLLSQRGILPTEQPTVKAL